MNTKSVVSRFAFTFDQKDAKMDEKPQILSLTCNFSSRNCFDLEMQFLKQRHQLFQNLSRQCLVLKPPRVLVLQLIKLGTKTNYFAFASACFPAIFSLR